ncbi:MAG: YjbQ family protein [Candidatus Eisenbacteria bacterium]|nr:YjbQ family protein [Candidatus Eisenbacteria bacterium]
MDRTITLRTPSRTALVDITRDVERAVAEMGLEHGAVVVYVPHTTAAVTINESADSDVASDIERALSRLVPASRDYGHTEGNADAHIKSSLIGCSRTLLVRGGRLVLGTWQGVFFCEFDGPRSRKVLVAEIGGRP